MRYRKKARARKGERTGSSLERLPDRTCPSVTLGRSCTRPRNQPSSEGTELPEEATAEAMAQSLACGRTHRTSRGLGGEGRLAWTSRGV